MHELEFEEYAFIILKIIEKHTLQLLRVQQLKKELTLEAPKAYCLMKMT